MTPSRATARRTIVLPLLLVVGACGGAGAPPIPDPSFGTLPSEVSPSPSPTMLPLDVGAVEAWKGVPVTTVCLATSQTYPQAPDFRLPIGDWVEALLVPVGVTVNGKDGQCDATLKVTVRIEGKSAKYGESATRYYTGVNRLMTVALSTAKRPAIKHTEKLNLAPGEYATNLDPTTPRGLLEDQSDMVVRAIIGGLVKIWGPAVAVQAMCVPVREEPYLSIGFQAEQVLLDTSGLRQVAIDDSGPVPNDYPSWRRWAETGEATEGEGGGTGGGCP